MWFKLFPVTALILVTACKHADEAHFAAGMAFSEYVTEQTGSPLKGCAAALGVGLLKEAYDSTGRGTADGRDVFATVAGCRLTYQF